jgi:hypothetical protein
MPLPGLCIERIDCIVHACVDDVRSIDRNVAIRAAVPTKRTLVVPNEVAILRIERLDEVAGVRKVHDAVIDQRSGLLTSSCDHSSRPDHAQLRDIILIDLVQRAVSPAILSTPPHEPVCGIRLFEHRVRDGHELPRALLRTGLINTCEYDDPQREREAKSLHRSSPIKMDGTRPYIRKKRDGGD